MVPVHVGEFASEMTVTEGDLPFSPAQMEKLVKAVCRRIEKEKQLNRQHQEATELQSGVAPRLDVG